MPGSVSSDGSVPSCVGAVVTAAGLSSRMGDFKPLMAIGAKSIARRVVETLQLSGAQPIVMVCGYRADELEDHLADTGTVFLRNSAFETTQMFDSALIGISYLLERGGIERILLTPVDVPLFSAETVRALIASAGQIVIPSCSGRRGHPMLLSREAAEWIMTYDGKDGMRGAMRNCDLTVEYVEVSDVGILHDADTPEDYRNLVHLADGMDD